MGMKKILTGLAAAIALMAVAGSASAQVAPTGTWTTRQTSSYGMYYGGGCSNGTYCYYIGGNGYYTGSNYYGVQRYDPVNNQWVTRTANTLGYYYSNHLSVVYANNLIWSFNSNNNPGYIFSYDDATGTWTLRDANVGFSGRNNWGCAVAVKGNDIYVIGGAGLQYTTKFNVSTPASLTFTNLPNYPGTNWNYTSALAVYEPISDRIYYLYGTALYPLNPNNDTWGSALATCPVSKAQWSYNIGVLFQGKGRIFATGGPGGTRTDEYFPGNNTWTQRATCVANHTYYNPGAASFSLTKAYAFGGNNAYYNCSEYTFPNYGLDPNDATSVQQIGSLGVTAQAGSDPDAGWTDAGITFSANCTDPDAGQNVRLEVQVKKASDPWSAAVQVNSTFAAQGVHTITYPIPAGDDYDWRYHVMDDYGNYNPNTGGVPGWHEFMKNSVTPDFRSDQVDPSVPVPVYPVSQDVVVPSLIAGDVTFSWSPSTDNGPTTAITYAIEVALNDPAFGTLAASASGIVPTNVTLNLATSRYNYYYQLNATDIGGNTSAWSAPATFRVVGDDGLNHSAGDAKRVLGCSSLAGLGSMSGALAGLALAALAAAKGLRRK